MKKQWVRIFGFVLVVMFVLSACGKKEEALEQNEYYVYYLKKDFSGLAKEVYSAQTEASETMDLIAELVKVLEKPAKDSSLHCALGDDCKLVNYQVVDGKMTINFDVNYGTLIGVEETLHRAAIVKTLTQIEGVNSVEFLVDSQPLMINKTAIGYMTGEDFIDSIGENGTNKKRTVLMYYANEDGTQLVEVSTEILYDSKVPLGSLMVEELLKGPKEGQSSEFGKLQKTIPENTKLNGMTIRDNICYVDFSREFTNPLPNISKEVTIYSVVNLLAELPNVNKVQFTIDGEQIAKFGDIDFSQAFERSLDVINQNSKTEESKSPSEVNISIVDE